MYTDNTINIMAISNVMPYLNVLLGAQSDFILNRSKIKADIGVIFNWHMYYCKS